MLRSQENSIRFHHDDMMQMELDVAVPDEWFWGLSEEDKLGYKGRPQKKKIEEFCDVYRHNSK